MESMALISDPADKRTPEAKLFDALTKLELAKMEVESLRQNCYLFEKRWFAAINDIKRLRTYIGELEVKLAKAGKGGRKC